MRKLGLLVAVLSTLAAPAMAGQIQVGYSGSKYGPYQSGQGGEFTLNDVNPDGWLNLSGYDSRVRDFGLAGTSSFQSFCIEKNEYLYPYDATYDATISQTAVKGGSGGASGDADPLSKGTGWLYQRFATGSLAGYNYVDSTATPRKASAADLQNVIWYLENELGDPAPDNAFATLVLGEFGTWENARADGGWNYGVYALNLTETVNGNTVYRQSQLIYVPDGGATLALLGCALVGLGALRRKFNV
jgi:hypothetical protein